jgi:hypothetical protein
MLPLSRRSMVFAMSSLSLFAANAVITDANAETPLIDEMKTNTGQSLATDWHTMVKNAGFQIGRSSYITESGGSLGSGAHRSRCVAEVARSTC